MTMKKLITTPPPPDPHIRVRKGDVLMFDYHDRLRVIRVAKICDNGDLAGFDLSRNGEYRQFHPAECVDPKRLCTYNPEGDA
jgi:hypothetical protein